jgi:hypothetical protein
MFGNDRISPELLLLAGSSLAGGQTVGQQLGGIGTNVAPLLARQAEQRQQMEQQNKTVEFIKRTNPQLAAQIEAGMPVSEAWRQINEAQQPKKSSFQVLPDGTYGAWDGQQFSKLGTAQKPADLPAFADEYNWMVTQGFKGTPEDYQKHKASLDDGKTSDRFKTELDTMKTYRSEDAVKTYTATRDGFEKVRSGAQLDSAQGDISLVFGFMKMLDPTSVVREGEFATAQNSGGIPDTVVNAYNKAMNGERLTPSQRQQFVQAAASQYKNTVENLENVNRRYSGFADAYDVPKDRFLEKPKTYDDADPLGIR